MKNLLLQRRNFFSLLFVMCAVLFTSNAYATTDSVCHLSPTKPDVYAKTVWTVSGTTVTIRTTLSKDYVDNTYTSSGTTSGYPGTHKLDDMKKDDYLHINLYDGNNTKKMELKIDYIEDDNNVPSGWITGGVSDGKGKVEMGNANDVLSVKTSLSENFNTLGYVYTTNSPSAAQAPNWIDEVWYEVTLNLSAFGTAGIGSVEVDTKLYAKKSKAGSDNEVVSSGICPSTMVKGTVFYDYNGDDDNIVNGFALGKPTPTTTLYVNLIGSNGNVFGVGTVNASGTYYIPNVTENASYTAVLSTNQGTVGNPAPTAELPVNWIFTGESPNTPTSDGTPDGILAVSVVNSTVDNCNFGIQNTVAISGSRCYQSPTKPDVWATSDWTITGAAVTIRTTFSKTFCDNTYGTGAIGWPGGKEFGKLVGSDHLALDLYDASGVKKMELEIDYIDADATVTSGFKCGGAQAGLGNQTSIIGATTSLSENLNTLGYSSYTVNSPATNSNYDINATAPNWIYEMWYEVTVNISEFGAAGFDGKIDIAGIHASPSKTGSNTEIVVPCQHLCGNVFKDTDGPDNVNGVKIYNTNFGLLTTELHANLIQGGVVKRTTPIESDGSYCFNNVDSFTTYTVCLDTLPALINSSSTTITPSLPEHWVSVSENCGLTGNDGLPADAKLTLTTGSPISGDIKDCNFGLVDTCVSITLTLDTVCRFDPIPLRDKEAELPLDLQGGTWHAYVYASSARLVLDTSYAIGVDDSTAKGQNADYVYTKGTYGIGCYAQDTFKVTSYEPNYTANIFNPDGGVLGDGISTLQFYYNAKELDGLATCGVVRLFIPRFGDRFVPKFDSTYTEQTVPIIGGGPVDNSEWFFDDTNPAYFLWTYVGDGSNDGVDSNGNMIWLDRFPAGGDKWMRFTGEYDAKGTAGQTSVSIQIFQGSGGETKITDNVTANVIVYGDGSTSQGPKPGGNHQPQDTNNSDKLEINKD